MIDTEIFTNVTNGRRDILQTLPTLKIHKAEKQTNETNFMPT